MVEENLPEGGKAYFMMGNHDLWNEGGKNFSECIGQPKNQYIERNGYPFITLSIDKDVNPYYEETSVNFLKEHLAKADKTYQGKPIFVLPMFLPSTRHGEIHGNAPTTKMCTTN